MKTFFFLLFTATVLSAYNQNCGYYYFQSNKTITLGMYNGKGSQSGKVVYTVGTVSKNGGTTSSDVTSEVFDKKNKSLAKASGKMKCNGGMLMVDMSMIMSQQSAFKNATVEGKGFFLEYPAILKPGQKLKDGKLDMDITLDKGITANVTMDITNRMVDGKEKVTTPAGTWEAYKISYTSKTSINMGFSIPLTMEITEWFVPDFGMIKSVTKNSSMELLSVN